MRLSTRLRTAYLGLKAASRIEVLDIRDVLSDHCTKFLSSYHRGSVIWVFFAPQGSQSLPVFSLNRQKSIFTAEK